MVDEVGLEYEISIEEQTTALSYGVDDLQVLEVYFDADGPIGFNWSSLFGSVRLYDMAKFRGSQTDMLLELFDNTIEVDTTFVPDIDPECLDESKFPNCIAGKYYPDQNCDYCSSIMC